MHPASCLTRLSVHDRYLGLGQKVVTLLQRVSRKQSRMDDRLWPVAAVA